MIEICVYGRGGQGGVTLAELVAHAAISEGKHAQSMPSFGPERRGAPVLAFLRVNEAERIKIRAEVTEPDVLVVLDPGLLHVGGVVSRLKKDGTAVVNTKKSHDEMKSKLDGVSKLATVDAMGIARDVLGLPIVNTTMIGAMVKATGVVKLASLEEPMKERFGKVATKNVEAMRKAYEETVVSYK
ncbi:MAG: 2-oxoacid:acceptor oxidoreductase family protein [Halobacteriota archaeon]